MNTDPFQNISLDPAFVKAANAVHDSMNTWIDGKIVDLKAQLTAQALTAAKQVSDTAHASFQRVIDKANDDLKIVEDNLSKITASFTAATPDQLKNIANDLQAAVTAQKTAIAQQQAQLTQIGGEVGSAIVQAVKLLA